MLACGHKSPHEQRRDFQRAQLAGQASANVEREDRDWRAFKTLTMRVYVDPAFDKREGPMREFVELRLLRINEVLEPKLGIRLKLEAILELPSSATAPGLHATLSALEALDAGDEVDFVLALVGGEPVATLSFHDLGIARVLGKHLVVRSMHDSDTRRALETYDAVSPEERAHFYRQRKQHKEVAILLHELAHVLGALHVTDTHDFMHPGFDPLMREFAGTNLEIMRRVLAHRAQAPAEQDLEALVGDLKALLSQNQWAGFIAEERSAQLASYDETLVALSATTSGATAPGAAPGPDLAGLSDEDREAFAQIDELSAAAQWPKVYELITQLATRYKDSYPVQHKACELGMRLGMALRELRGYCDRMSALSLQAASAR